MATMNSSWMLLLTLVLGATLLGSCMAKTEITTQRWGWGRGWGSGKGWHWGWGRGHGARARARAPPPPPPAAYNYSHGSSGCPTNVTRGSNKIVVGGSNNWNFGFNYMFKYNAPINTTPGHSVYLLPDFWSYLKCDLRRATRVASTTEGGGDGFQFKLTKWQPHYFACGEHNGIHCNLGMMKFFVMPIFRYSN
ncbi:Protein YIF1A [Bienertia sinuspersici]